MSKLILSGKEANEKLVKGVNVVADVVKSTLGPKGRNVIIKKNGAAPLITNDGATIAKEISLKDNFEDVGAQLVIDASSKTNKEAGDGTTTTAVLTQSLINSGIKEIENGIDPIDLRKGMNTAVIGLTELLKQESKEISSDEDIKKIAAISSGSEEIGSLIAEAYSKIGKNGAITTEDSKTNKTTVEIKDGYRLYKGMASPYLFEPGKSSIDITDAAILVTSAKVDNIQLIAPVLNEIAQQGGKLVIFAESFTSQIIDLLVVNHLRGLQVFAIEASGYGTGKTDTLSDIAVITGAKFFNPDKGLDYKEATINDLGMAKQVKVNSDIETLVIGGMGEPNEIENRVNEVRSLLDDKNLNEHDITRINNRIANLSNGIAVISVGSSSNVELEELKLRLEDALCSVKSSLEEGIVPGAGSTFIKLSALYKIVNGSKSFELGQKIVLDSISSLLNQILLNADYSEDRIKEIIDKVKEGKELYNLATESFEDIQNALVFDPTKVERVSLSTAVSIASTVLTSDSIITEEPEDKTQFVMQAPIA